MEPYPRLPPRAVPAFSSATVVPEPWVGGRRSGGSLALLRTLTRLASRSCGSAQEGKPMRRYIALAVAALVHIVCASPASPQTAISFGETLAASITAPGEVDTYTFSAVANDRVMVGMAIASGGLDPEIVLYNPSGQAICSAYYGYGGATEINDCTLPVSGTYTLLADDAGDRK